MPELIPANSDQYVTRGRLRWSGGDLGGALRDFDAALELTPGHQEASLSRSALCEQQGDFDRALAALSEAITRCPDNLWGDQERGIPVAKPHLIRLLWARVHLRRRHGRDSETGTDLLRLSELDPEDAEARRLIDGLRR